MAGKTLWLKIPMVARVIEGALSMEPMRLNAKSALFWLVSQALIFFLALTPKCYFVSFVT